MIHTLVLDREARTFTQVADADAISGLCSNDSKIVWVDVSDPTSLDFDNLARQFGSILFPSKIAAISISVPRLKSFRAITSSCSMRLC